MNVEFQREILECYLSKVYGLKIDLGEVLFPAVRPGCTCMFNPPKLATEDIFFSLAKEANVVAGAWLEPSDSALFSVESQKRPAGSYLYSYLDSPEADYVGESQEGAVARTVPFMNVREYLLATGFYHFRTKRFLDRTTLTLLANRWNYGGIDSGMVYGFFQHRGRNPEGHDPEGYDGVCLFNGPPKFRFETAGPRQIFF